MRFPPPLQPGDRIGVTSPSSGVRPSHLRRLDHAVADLRRRGYEVVVGDQLVAEDGGITGSAPARAAELTAMLLDPSIRAVVPPWGGELAIQLLDHLDWDALRPAEPTWLVGFSDITTLMVPLATRLGWASLHGANLMDTPYAPPAGMLHWTEVASAQDPVSQRPPGRHRSRGWDDFEQDPAVAAWTLDAEGSWDLVGAERLEVTGRLVGGCIEVLSPLVGTPYADLRSFGSEHAEDGLLVYVEAAEDVAFAICRALHGMRMAGWFDRARAVLVGRTAAPDSPGLTQREAVLDALGGLGVPLVFDVECGHVPPYLPLVNGALTRVVVDGDHQEVQQTWP